MRTLLIALFVLGPGLTLTGCSHTYDGSEKYGEQMPQYQYDGDNPTPDYMHPADSDMPSH